MKIILNESLKRNENRPMGDSGFLGLVSHCYSNHLPLAINPHDIWVIFLSEIAKIIAQSPEEYREHFTDSSAKKLILVPTGSLTEIPMGLLSSKLIENLKFDSKIFLRSFTTNTPFVEEVFQALLCDISSPYYNYGMFACGYLVFRSKELKKIGLTSSKGLMMFMSNSKQQESSITFRK